MKKNVFFFSMLLCLFGCANKRQVFKTISLGPNNIIWFRESYLTSTRAFITFENNSDTDTLLTCNDSHITDIQLSGDTVLIYIYDLAHIAIYSKKDKVKSYKIQLKDATYGQWFKHYHPGERLYPIKDS